MNIADKKKTQIKDQHNNNQDSKGAICNREHKSFHMHENNPKATQ
jgi:hypothetical protein